MVIDIQIEEGEPLGAVPNDKLIITRIQSGTIAEGKLQASRLPPPATLQVGDRILKVNNKPTVDEPMFFRQLRFAPPLASITIVRDEEKAKELNDRVSVLLPPPFNKTPFRNIPAERAKFIQRRDGYSYFVAKLTLVPGQKLGLAIKHYQNRVLVSKAEPGSVAGVELQVRGGEGRGNSQVGDHLVDVNAVPVTDKDVARGLLIKALQARPSPSLRTCSKAAT